MKARSFENLLRDVAVPPAGATARARAHEAALAEFTQVREASGTSATARRSRIEQSRAARPPRWAPWNPWFGGFATACVLVLSATIVYRLPPADRLPGPSVVLESSVVAELAIAEAEATAAVEVETQTPEAPQAVAAVERLNKAATDTSAETKVNIVATARLEAPIALAQQPAQSPVSPGAAAPRFIAGGAPNAPAPAATATTGATAATRMASEAAAELPSMAAAPVADTANEHSATQAPEAEVPAAGGAASDAAELESRGRVERKAEIGLVGAGRGAASQSASAEPEGIIVTGSQIRSNSPIVMLRNQIPTDQIRPRPDANRDDGVNRILLATDGDFNVGIANQDELKSYVARQRDKGIYLSVLGFGAGNYHDAMAQTLAQNGNGVAAYIDTLQEARKVLVQEATSSLFPIAKDVKIQVEFNPETVAEYRLVGYETRALNREDFNNDKVDAGDIGSGHSVTAIYEVTPVASPARLIDESRYADRAQRSVARGKNDEYGFLRIRYKLPDETSSRLIERPIAFDASVPALLKSDLAFASAVAGFGQLLRGNAYTGPLTFETVISQAQAGLDEDPNGYRREFVELVRQAQRLAGR